MNVSELRASAGRLLSAWLLLEQHAGVAVFEARCYVGAILRSFQGQD